MNKILTASILTILMITYATAQAITAPTCIRFDACVDGSDWVTVDNGQLTMEHNNHQPIGSHDNCDQTWWDIIKIDGVSHTVVEQSDHTYLIDGVSSLPVSIDELESFNLIAGRGAVTQDEETIYIDDDSYNSGYIYRIDLCGEPKEVSVPEFASMGVAAAILLTSSGFAYMMTRKRN